LADRIALLDGGRLQQLATPVKLVEQPANEFVDTFLGRHRFQLSLLTKSIKAVMGKPHVTARSDGTKPQTCLRTNDSLVEALDLFKKTGSETLPVYESEQLVGCLAKNKLVKLIARMLGDSEGDT
jgi:ABC-type proline/glycine betaine transport system ATPase subunit